MPLRVTVILNPTAGFSRARRRAQRSLDRLAASGIELEIERTERPRHATELARTAALRGDSEIAAIGGDGTAWEVLNGLFDPDLAKRRADGVRPRLAILPVGTGNSLMNDLSENGADTVIDALEQGRTRTLDLFRFSAVTEEGEPWQCHLLGNLSLGFPAEVVEITYRRFKGLGAMGYTLGFLAALSGYRPIEIGVSFDLENDADLKAPPERHAFLAVNNNPTFGGNMRFAPDARVDDGLADVFQIDPVSRFELLKTFPRIYRGTHVDHPAVHSRLARQVHFHCPGPIEVLIDGELERLEPKSLEVLPQAIDLFV